MRQDNTSALSGLASFAKLQELLAARSHAGSVEAMMTFETFEVGCNSRRSQATGPAPKPRWMPLPQLL